MPNDYGISPWALLDILSPIIFLMPAVLTLLVFGPLLLYPLARWKLHRAQVEDPQLGLKVVLHYFALIAFQLLLVAGVIIIFTLFAKDSTSKGSFYRAGFALLVPAATVFFTHVLGFLRRTNQDQFPTVRRLFLGYNLAITGLVGFVMLLVAFQLFFKKGSAGDEGRLAIAGVLVYVGAWAACGIQFGRAVIGDNSASAGPPSASAAPPIMSVPTVQSGPVLPSLSSGTYPPIDQK
jgi:hypothetical protein